MHNISPSSRHFLLLFDIDGTLVRMTSGLPRGLFEEMIFHFFGRRIELVGYKFAGKTDRGIIREICEAAGVSEKEMRSRESEVVDWIGKNLDLRINKQTLQLLPGVIEILDAVSARTDTTVAVLTGNLPECAAIKLRPYGLEKYFKFFVCGIESEERNDLGPIALERAIEHLDGRSLDSEDVVVIGDSVRDVECAHAIHARCLVTLTSNTTREEIEPLAPAHIFSDLSDTASVLSAIYGVPL